MPIARVHTYHLLLVIALDLLVSNTGFRQFKAAKTASIHLPSIRCTITRSHTIWDLSKTKYVWRRYQAHSVALLTFTE